MKTITLVFSRIALLQMLLIFTASSVQGQACCECSLGPPVSPQIDADIDMEIQFFTDGNLNSFSNIPDATLGVNASDLSKLDIYVRTNYNWGSFNHTLTIVVIRVSDDAIIYSSSSSAHVIGIWSALPCGLYKIHAYATANGLAHPFQVYEVGGYVCIKKTNRSFSKIILSNEKIVVGDEVTLTTDGNEAVLWVGPDVNTIAKSITIVPTSSGVINYTAVDIGSDWCTSANAPFPISINAMSAQQYYYCQGKFVDNVISATSIRFSDNVPVDYKSVQVDAFNTVNPYENGTKGIWRAEESFVYVNERGQDISKEVETWKDGTYDQLPLFDWNTPYFERCYPKWRKTNTITKYNANNFEVENKDILNRYSAALYGFKGQLSIAVAANAKSNEIGFESFEEYTPLQDLTPSNSGSGNISIFNTSPSNTDYMTEYDEYDVLSSDVNVVTVNAPSGRFTSGQKVIAYGSWVFRYTDKSIFGNTIILSVAPDPDGDANHCTLTLSPLNSYFAGDWIGKLRVAKPYSTSTSPKVDNENAMVQVVSGIAHTGDQCLSLDGNIEIEQEKLKLEGNKKYLFSCWIKSNLYTSGTALRYTTSFFNAADNTQVLISYKDNNGNMVGNFVSFDPSGPVIEGWQKIEGEFLMPVGAGRIVLKIQSGKTNICPSLYLDDLRIQPSESGMKTYVYDKNNLRLRAILDENNYASMYYYDAAGNLYLLEKETIKGVMTIQESIQHAPSTDN